MATTEYRPGNPFIDRVTVAEAAVQWQQLTAEHKALVVVEDGLPYLAGVPELRHRAEALVDAARRGKLAGLTHNEDGYPLNAEVMQLDRRAIKAFVGQFEDASEASALCSFEGDTLLRVKEVCERLGISRATFYRRIEAGKIDAEHANEPPRWRASYIESLVNPGATHPTQAFLDDSGNR